MDSTSSSAGFVLGNQIAVHPKVGKDVADLKGLFRFCFEQRPYTPFARECADHAGIHNFTVQPNGYYYCRHEAVEWAPYQTPCLLSTRYNCTCDKPDRDSNAYCFLHSLSRELVIRFVAQSSHYSQMALCSVFQCLHRTPLATSELAKPLSHPGWHKAA